MTIRWPHRAAFWQAALLVVITGLSPGFGSAQTLQWESKAGYRVAPLPVPATGKTGFTLLTGKQTQIHFTNTLTLEQMLANQNLMNGAGVAAGDFDHDGWCDLYFCNRAGKNALYRNRGNWQFEDVTDRLGVGCTNMHSSGAVFADLNGDGWLDLFVTSNDGPNACFLNDGQGHFTNVTDQAGLRLMNKGGTSIALADIDGNGTLDLYVANYGENTILRGGGVPSIRFDANGKPYVSGRHARRLKLIDGNFIELGEADVLYLNDGHAHFTPVAWNDGRFRDEDGKPIKDAPLDLSLSVVFRDLNGDGFPDIYECNDFQTPDRIWLNDGKGNFRALPRLAMRTQSNLSMGVDFADVDRDGFDDFLVVDMRSRDHTLRMRQMLETNVAPRVIGTFDDRPQIPRNTFFHNRGDGTYAELAWFAGVESTDWSWCPVFMDVDLDGYEDLLVSNGHTFDILDWDTILKPKPPGGASLKPMISALTDFPLLRTPNYAFRNRRDLTFEETGAAWGFNSSNVSHGLILCDLDNDGDCDVVVSCLNEPPLLYRNESAAPRVAVRLKGKSPNTQGIGAKIRVFVEGRPTQSQEVICGGRYLSGDDPMRMFAAFATDQKLRLEITWRNGTRSVVPDARANHIYEVDESGAVPAPIPAAAPNAAPPLFKDVSERIAHTHHEEAFDDFTRQILLPKQLSQLGPGVAWADLNGDGFDELLIGSGKGGALAVFANDGRGGFKPWNDPAWSQPAARDQTSLLVWTPRAGITSVLVGLASYEDGQTNQTAVQQFQLNGGSINALAAVPDSAASTGPLAVADYDGDGKLDLFVGGRVVPGRYPEATSSRLFHNDGGQLVLDAANSRVLEKIGLVSGAVFSDLNGDGWPDLVLAIEWGPVRVFLNERGKLRDATRELGLDRFTGWWNGVATGDFDGDGRLDIVASNWGLNTPFRASVAQPLRLYFGDFSGTGGVDLIESEFDPVTAKIAPRHSLNLLGLMLPVLNARYPSYRSFSTVSVVDVLGEQFPRTSVAQATTLASTVFLNRGDRFVAQPLPAEAQWAPAFGVCVADADGDGREDIFLSQNFFNTHRDTPRLDAGRGLWLRGNGDGTFVPLSAKVSGVEVYGEQRGAAVGDFDGDGRVDLVVTQNGAATRLFHNESARPGLRVRLSGPPENPRGVGVTVRLKFGGRFGPAREIQAGSGYWSQNSATLVLSMPETPTEIWTRWPGGKIITAKLLAETKEISLDTSGIGKVLR